MIRHRERDSGATLIGVIIALNFLAVLIGLVLWESGALSVLRDSGELKMRALLLAVNAMELLKTEKNPSSSLRREGDFLIQQSVEELGSSFLLLRVSVMKGDGQEILSLRTLKKQRVSSP